jgi:hypothetical protein
MRYNFIVLFLLCVSTLFAQEKKQVDSLNFCSFKYKVPAGCVAESEYQVTCDNYSMVWLYMNEQMMKANVPEQFINSLKEQKGFKKSPLDVYILKQKMEGYRISFKTAEGKLTHQICAYGTINNQPVLVQLSLSNEAKINEQLPDFPRQIISLENH